MSRRLRPAGSQKPCKTPSASSPAGLDNPYTRYYTRPRSFEQLVQQRRPQPPASPKK